MQIFIVTSLVKLIAFFSAPLHRQKLSSSALAGTTKIYVLIIVSFFLVLSSSSKSFSQSRKEKTKLGMVKVKSEGYKRKKAKETASFTNKGYNNNAPGGSAKDRQKMSSFVGNGLVPVSKPGGSNIGNPGRAEAYRNLRPLKPGRNPMGEQIARKSDAYKGNGLVESDYKKRKDARKRDDQFGHYKGVLVKSDYKKRQDARKKSQQISRYRGDLLVKKVPKGAHPSSVWRGGKVKNSYQQKEKYRQRMMKRIGRNKNNLQPNYLRKKNRDEKPTYDSRESEIWSKPR
jgi:hypothetical protein